MGEFRALTVRPPWAQAITFGGKSVENRTWPTRYRGLVAVHAGRSVDWDAVDQAWTAARVTPYRQGLKRAAWTGVLDLGAVIAVAELVGCHHADYCDHVCPEPEDWNPDDNLPCTEHEGPCNHHCTAWSQPGQWHWQLAGVRPLAEPVPCRGMLGLWRLPGDVEKTVRAQLKEADRG